MEFTIKLSINMIHDNRYTTQHETTRNFLKFYIIMIHTNNIKIG
jgi:hypothetical protein